MAHVKSNIGHYHLTDKREVLNGGHLNEVGEPTIIINLLIGSNRRESLQAIAITLKPKAITFTTIYPRQSLKS